MQEQLTDYQQELTERISHVVDKLFRGSSFYMVKLDQYEMTEMLIELFSRFSPEEMRAIKEHDLTRRIDKILVLEAVAGTLNDLTPEEIAIFDAAVAGK
ncbi:MAG: hypothetical protein ACK6A9_17710 [Dolichospermum sp.]|jgi:uncharacterized protein YfkK (UPF0435 family)|uniref:hypothetical protein n=1 Tax=Dolichospermum circinale TaxID=109265 RepID=UPI000407159F|nr:hypothetical protein [Dolichospermum circinale]MCE2718478.1 hypothetical protein [Anabaena sp. 49628_E55]MDB9483857.1 hypothetical protein [Dolichospermum circinale CS-537/05]MDB9456473.1 hypothetical protein [Dolichospermum circinale CS-541/06]MDB9464321.1 hypothetical protein [Dolichospermum circinale CS-541/04]MDB9476215.1 hypothetical protein [Dolichospermum circinale CS-537/11]